MPARNGSGHRAIRLTLLVTACLAGVAGCAGGDDGCDRSVATPPGFCAQLFAEDVGPARHLAAAPWGDVYVARWREGSRAGGVLALRDTNADGRADLREAFGPEAGSGISLGGEHLFLGAWGRVYRWKLRRGELVPRGEPEVFADGIPELEHGARSLALGTDGALYVNIGAPSNACERDFPGRDLRSDRPCRELESSGGVWRFPGALLPIAKPLSPSRANRYATGLRHSVALGVDERDGSIYAAPHGIDHLDRWWPEAGFTAEDAAAKPGETLFRIREGGDYGFPYCMYDPALGRMVRAPAYGGTARAPEPCAGGERPIAVFAAHAAPMAIAIYHGARYPARYQGGMFVALHGSIFRHPLEATGYSVEFLPRRADGFGPPESFFRAAGGGRPWSGRRPRPSGLAVGPDGSLYVSDDSRGVVWRIHWRGE